MRAWKGGVEGVMMCSADGKRRDDVPEGKENGGEESVPLASPGPMSQVVCPSLSVPSSLAVNAIGSASGTKSETTSASAIALIFMALAEGESTY